MRRQAEVAKSSGRGGAASTTTTAGAAGGGVRDTAGSTQAQMMGNSLVLELEGLVDQVCYAGESPPRHPSSSEAARAAERCGRGGWTRRCARRRVAC